MEATGGATRGSSSSAEKEKAGDDMIFFFAGREPMVVFLSPKESLMGGVDIFEVRSHF